MGATDRARRSIGPPTRCGCDVEVSGPRHHGDVEPSEVGVCTVAAVLRMSGARRFTRMPVRLRRCRVGVRDNRVILLQFRMGRIAVVHIRHPRFGDCRAEGEEQDDGDETAEMHAVTALDGGAR